MTPPRTLSSLPSALGNLAAAGLAISRTGVVGPVRPDRLAGMAIAALRSGPTIATGYAAGAARHPERTAVIDERGSLTYAEMQTFSRALAVGLAEGGVRAGDKVGVLLRNSRYLLLTLAALGELGADALLLNTGFAAPQATEVLQRHDARAVVHDAEFAAVVEQGAAGRLRVVGWPDTTSPRPRGSRPGSATAAPAAVTIDDLVRRHRGQAGWLRRPRWNSRLIILTSGTTGAPKGASRGGLHGASAANLFTAMPIRSGDVTVIACPIFHSWGLGNAAIALALGSTIVLRRHFDPEKALADVARHRAAVLAVVPVMMQRMVDLPAVVRGRYDVSCLRVVGASGSALAGNLAQRFMDAFGDVIYNLYGSTEVGYVTVAGPADLRAAPGTAGRPVRGNTIELLDPADEPVPADEIGRVFVGGPLLFEGYTGGGDKQRVRGLVATGDVGYFDASGRLFITGRDDDMIVSGGENVFPAEVEDLLARQPEIAEAAVTGVDDEKFGQRLAAFVVLRDGAELSEDQVRARVRRDLAGYKVPRDVTFVDALPRNDTGKVVKRQLRS